MLQSTYFKFTAIAGLCSVTFLGALMSAASAATMTFEDTEVADTHVIDSKPKDNFGSDPQLVIKNRYGVHHAMLRFDLSALSGKTVTGATLSMRWLFFGGDANNELRIYRLTSD